MRNNHHTTDREFLAKAPMYKTARLAGREYEYVKLLAVVDSNIETGVMFKVSHNGHISFYNDRDLDSFCL